MEPKAKADLAALREVWQDEFCESSLRRGNCGCSRCLDDLLRRGVAHAIELAMAEVESAIPSNWVDELLTGPAKALRGKNDCRDIERLLRGVRDRVGARLAALKGGA